jgi:sugar lactone lactonase YvrE
MINGWSNLTPAAFLRAATGLALAACLTACGGGGGGDNPAMGTVTLLAGDLEQAGAVDATGSAARFNDPRGLAVDASGHVLVADTFNHSIRKIQPDGVVSTLAGLNGTRGTADGSSAAARFIRPVGLTLDAEGVLYVMDGWELMPFSLLWHSIRTIDRQAEVRTAYSVLPGQVAADRPLLTSPGLAAGPNGDVYAVAYQGLWRFGRTSAPVRLADIASPLYESAVARDAAGNLYFTYSNSIRKLSADGTTTTFAGSISEAGSADGTGTSARFGFNNPANAFSDGSGFLAFDASGNLFVSDTRNHTIRKITPNGVVTTVAGKAGVSSTVLGPLANASLKSPRGIAVANEKLLYVVSGHAVLKVALP